MIAILTVGKSITSILFSRYVKAVAALLGGITPSVLIVIAQYAGLNLSPDTATLLAAILTPIFAAVATWRAPANQAPPAPPAPLPAAPAPVAAPPAAPVVAPADPAVTPPATPPAPPATPPAA
jgi:hypothetical protein